MLVCDLCKSDNGVKKTIIDISVIDNTKRTVADVNIIDGLDLCRTCRTVVWNFIMEKKHEITSFVDNKLKE